ncbi:hypothetical protein PT282_06425 [Bifidobacterium sp. ESL0763]|uniref:hypothetical protein n=1 Tax=Bifidobacterium sp. ESL0763 TaxID=2983227 RepID=UPI0023F884F8|nr:hypothetical protein [Bifidobacterium sp. ESL0763]MDF7664295.1 hypothetical protein [Bifidobacterium sp. ESL0763]
MTSQQPRKRGKKRKPSKRQQRIYLRRRIVVGIVLLALLALVIFGLYSLGRGIGMVSKSIGHYEEQSVSRSQASAKKARKTPQCGVKDLRLELEPKSQSVDVGGSLEFDATIEHVGSRTCLVDGSNVSRVLTITSGDDTIWRSDTCPADKRMLLMAKGDKDSQKITWNANQTGGKCVSDDLLPKVDSGTYHAQLTLKDHAQVVSRRVPISVD